MNTEQLKLKIQQNKYLRTKGQILTNKERNNVGQKDKYPRTNGKTKSHCCHSSTVTSARQIDKNVSIKCKWLQLWVLQHWKKNLSHFDLKRWVIGGTKIRPGIPSNWRIFESIWLDIAWESIWQVDSQYLVNLTQILYLSFLS